MHYELIVNQPFQSTSNVLAAAFRFVCAYDPHLLRLEEHWRVIPNGIAIHDSFNNRDLPFGREATMEEWESESDKCFSNDYGSYMLLDDLSKELLDDILEVFNDHYSADCFAIIKTAIGFGFYKCVHE